MSTTSEYRKQARAAGEQLDFARAADLYQMAIDAYPKTAAAGALGQADLATMRRARDSYQRMSHEQEINPAI